MKISKIQFLSLSDWSINYNWLHKAYMNWYQIDYMYFQYDSRKCCYGEQTDPDRAMPTSLLHIEH